MSIHVLVAVRSDFGALATLGLRYGGALVKTIFQGGALTRPFDKYYAELGITDAFLKNYLNLLCFLLQGLPANGTLSAVMAYMIDDFYKPNAVMDFPKGGSGAIVGALRRGVEKYSWGKVVCRATVEEIIVEDESVVGVRVKYDGSKDSSIVRASSVVSNVDLWGLLKLVPVGKCGAFDEERTLFEKNVPLCKSFVSVSSTNDTYLSCKLDC